MYNLRVWGNITFPHYLGHTTNQYTVLLVKNEGTKIISAKPIDKSGYDLVISQSADWDIICDPTEHVKIGEKFEHPYFAGVDYTITDILEVRDAKGNWQRISTIPPHFIKVRAILNSFE